MTGAMRPEARMPEDEAGVEPPSGCSTSESAAYADTVAVGLPLE